VRRVPGVLRADALFGAPDIMALIEGESIEQLDHVIDGIGALDGVEESETKIIRWV
jgi:DNA-binding Lrp family transcriptional regulator